MDNVVLLILNNKNNDNNNIKTPTPIEFEDEILNKIELNGIKCVGTTSHSQHILF